VLYGAAALKKEFLLSQSRRMPLLRGHCRFCLIVALAMGLCATIAAAQTSADSQYYARKNTFGFLAAYSPDSSHIVMGNVENRMLLDFGGVYGRRLFLNHVVNWQYDAELLPVALESDPVLTTVTTYTSTVFPGEVYTGTFTAPTEQTCYPTAGSGVITDYATYTYVGTCSRRWTIGEAMSPVGFQWNFLPRRRMQPFFIGHGGYMYSTQPIPLNDAGSFNFTFDLGVGLEYYRSKTRSIRGEFRFHHISNHNTAIVNPGIDNLLYQVTYAFGR
jgi:hypothetical protein